MKNFLTIIFCLFFSWMTAAAQDAARPVSTIRANGDAVITVKPDRAQIDIGVVTQAVASQETVEQNSRQIDAVVAALRKLLGAGADIKTISYGLTPKYRYPQPPQQQPAEPTITGYTAVNIVRIVITDLEMLGKVIDTAGAAGANQIQSLQFMVGNQQSAQTQALNEAALIARRKADQLASAMGVKVVRILSLTDTSQPGVNQQFATQFFAGSRGAADLGTLPSISAPAVYAPRTIEIRATVTLALEVAP